MKKIAVFTLALVGCVAVLSGCGKKKVDGKYDFIIYESDSDNTNLSDNKVVAKYTIEYTGAKTVTDTLIKKDGDKYYFSKKSDDYLVLADSAYGLSYTNGYFKDYSECKDKKEIDVSWSLTTVNGEVASTGIGATPLEGLKEYGFVIDGWKTAA